MKWLKYYWSQLCGILDKIMVYNPMAFQINQQAIINWQVWLNTHYPPASWIPIDGFWTTTQLNFDSSGSPQFNGNAGYPLKGFVNTATGEIKYFDARRFFSV